MYFIAVLITNNSSLGSPCIRSQHHPSLGTHYQQKQNPLTSKIIPQMVVPVVVNWGFFMIFLSISILFL
jgi:hypothetical protein